MTRANGVRLGVDVGDVRIGVAVSDPDGLLATPVETVTAGRPALDRLLALTREHRAVSVVLGLPRSLSGQEGPAAAKARAFGRALARAVAPVPVRLVDERLSTATAERSLRTPGARTARPGARNGARRRSVVDQAAAVVILQSALDAERAQGAPVGELVAPPAAGDDAGGAPGE